MTIGTLINLLQATLEADIVNEETEVQLEFSDMNLQNSYGGILGVKMYNSGAVVIEAMEGIEDEETSND
jgi:hypothetical protein